MTPDEIFQALKDAAPQRSKEWARFNELRAAGQLPDPTTAFDPTYTQRPQALNPAYRVGFTIPEGLHPNTATLVRDFAEAMAKKLRTSEIKHGWTANWMRKDWRDELAAELLRHVHKGDPIDVAAYAAFAWFHGWSVTPAEASATSGGQVAMVIPYTDEDGKPDMDDWRMIAIGRPGDVPDHVLDRIPTKAAGIICEAINRSAPQPAGMVVLTERLRQMDAYLAEGIIVCPRCSEEITTSDMDVRSDIAELIDALTGLPPGHVVIEQSETLDHRIAQTIQRPDGTDYVRVLPGGDDAPRPALIYPDDLTLALMEALGVPNFKASPIAHALRAAGADIPRKSEAEQAHVLHWFVKLALQHGDGWWKVAGDEIQRIALAARQSAGEGSANG